MNLSYPLEIKGTITSEYGNRIHPVKKELKHHNGIDIGVETGTSVRSIADGEVVRSDMNDKKGYGNFICVKHNNLNGSTKFSCYAHLSKRLKSVGDEVVIGEEIGKSGGGKNDVGAGNSTGPHLHFEIRNTLSGDWDNPERYLKSGKIDVLPLEVLPDKKQKESFLDKLKDFSLKDIFSKYAKEYDSLSKEKQAMYEEVDRIKDIMKKIL